MASTHRDTTNLENHMVPAVVTANVATRLGPWLGRAAASNKALVPSIVARLRAVGMTVGDSIADIVNAAKRSPTSALTVLGVLASVGMTVSDFFDGSAEGEAVKSKLAAVTNGSTPAERNAAFNRLFDIGEKSVDSSLRISDEQAANNEAIREVLSWAIDHYGSRQAALRAHTMSQAFVELSYETVTRGFEQLNLRR